VAGAFFHTRVGTPSIVTVSISNFWPGAVSNAAASASVQAGHVDGGGTGASLAKAFLSVLNVGFVFIGV